MKKSIISIVTSICLATACVSTVQAKSVSTDGSTSMEKVIGSLGEAFCMEHSDIDFTYNPTGSSSGINAAIEKRADIGLSSRNLKDNEKQDLNAITLAFDGIVLVVNKDNNVNNLSLDEIKQVFSGSIKNWKELGGEDRPIVLIGREAGSGTRDGFETITHTKDFCKYRQELTSTGDVLTSVASNVNAIGYASLASNTSKVKILTVDGVMPSAKSIADSSYKIQRPFLLVTNKSVPLSPEAKLFIDFTQSEKGQEIQRKVGVIPAHNN